MLLPPQTGACDMDWFPLWNSLRIAGISTIIAFFTGILAAYYIAKIPRALKGALDVVLTLPLVLPPTVVGHFCHYGGHLPPDVPHREGGFRGV